MQKEYDRLLEKKEKEISRLKNEISKLEYSREFHLNNYSRTWLEYKDLRQKYNELQETGERKRKYPKQEQTLSKINTDKLDQSKERASEIEKLNAKLSELEQIYNDLQERKTQNEDLHKEIDDLKKKCKTHEQTISKKSNTILQQRNAHRSQIKQLKSEIDNLRIELEHNQASMSEIEYPNRYYSELQQIYCELDERRTQDGYLHNKIDDLERKCQVHEQTIGMNNNVIFTLQNLR